MTEEATMTTPQPESDVDVDDLVFALGQGVVYKMAAKKRDERIAKNIKLLVDDSQAAKAKLIASEKEKATKVAALQTSNDQLGAKVIQLGDSLRDVNAELKTAQKAAMEQKRALLVLEKALGTATTERDTQTKELIAANEALIFEVETRDNYCELYETAQKELDRRDKISAGRRKKKV